MTWLVTAATPNLRSRLPPLPRPLLAPAKVPCAPYLQLPPTVPFTLLPITIQEWFQAELL